MAKAPSKKIVVAKQISEQEAIEKQWLNPTEAAEHLGVSRETLYRLMDSGDLPYYTFKKIQKRRIKREDLDALLVKGGPIKKGNS